LAAIVSGLCASIACSHSRADAASAASADPSAASGASGADTGTVAFDCAKVFSTNDATGLLKGPVTLDQLPNRAVCNFLGAGVSDIMVTVGGDESNEMLWNDATVSSNRTMFTALPGVGDQAAFKAGTQAEDPELVSKKGTVYCTVTIDGGAANVFKSLGSAELAKRLGALCTKAFVAMHA
jgi:hypothetical protein